MPSKLKILVPVKKTIDAAIKPRINKTNTGIETEGVKFAINPFDDIAVEEALKIKELKKSLVESIHAVTIGDPKTKDILINCVAKGVDKTSLVSVDTSLQPLSIAKVLQKMVVDDKSNLVIMGKQAIDDDSNQTGQLLAGLLNWPQAVNASKVIVDESSGEVEVHQEIDGGSSVIKAQLPLVITTDLRLNTPRYVTLPKLMKAKKKAKPSVVELKDLGLEDLKSDNRLKVVNIEEPPVRQAGKIINSVSELVAELKAKNLF